MAITVGIDRAKEFHWATAVDERGGELLSRRVENEPASIQGLIEELEQALARHPDAALSRSLPGMGATLTAEFIAEAGGIGRFPTPDGLAAAGLAPVLRQSGKVRYLQRARSGNKTLKRVLYQFTCLLAPASRQPRLLGS